MEKIASARLIYEKIKEADFQLFYILYADPLVMSYTYLDASDDVTQLRKNFSDVVSGKTYTYFTIREILSGTSIGFVYYNFDSIHPNGGIVDIGYILSKDFWGNKYGSEAGQWILNYCFTHLDIHKITANLHTENSASEKILLKIGMKKEGIARAERYKNGKWCDELKYGILKEEWSEQQLKK